MPTPESERAFAKLVRTRSRLNEISKLLNEAIDSGKLSGQPQRRELEQQWDLAFHEFEAATNEFYATVRQFHDQVEARGTNRRSS